MDNQKNQCLEIQTEIGQTYIMGVSRVNETSFAWSKPHSSLEGVHFNYTAENMNKLCGMTKFENLKPQPAESSSLKCPEITNNQLAACPAGIPQSIGLFSTTVLVFLTYLLVSK